MGNPRYANGSRRRSLQARVYATQDTCWLCGRPVDTALRGAKAYNPRTRKMALHPLAPVLDEVVPVSLGGSPYDPENVRLAHNRCNMYRSNRTDVDNVRRELAAIMEREEAARPRPSQDW